MNPAPSLPKPHIRGPNSGARLGGVCSDFAEWGNHGEGDVEHGAQNWRSTKREGVDARWWIVLGCTVVGLLLALLAMRQWRSRVSYWV